MLFSDIDGLYTADPRHNPDAQFIPVVEELTPEIEAMAGDPGTGYGSGGMVTKLAAARICLSAGCRMAIARGNSLNPLAAIEAGGRCTWFLPSAEPYTARKQWIFGSMNPVGGVTIDDGAARALTRGKSLLPAGIIAVEGAFERGDCILVRAGDGRVLARGLTNYSAEDAVRLVGRHSHEIESVLGFRGRDEMIHRDDLVMEG